MCVPVCMCVCAYVFHCLRVYVPLSTHVCVCMCVWMGGRMSNLVHIPADVEIHHCTKQCKLFLCMYVCML